MFLYLTLTFCFGYGQGTDMNFFSEVFEELEINSSDVYERLLSSEKFGTETLLVIPVVSEQGEGFMVFDAYLVLVENEGGKILSKYYGEKEWYSDAVYLSEIEIDQEVSGLGPGKTYGLKIQYYIKSRYNPYSSTELSLYTRDGLQIRKVLSGYRTFYQRGETDGDCVAEIETCEIDLKISDSQNYNYRDLMFTATVEKSISTTEDCELRVVDTSHKSGILKFREGSYKEYSEAK